jgi:SNF2-related domain/Ring finger domain
MHLCRFGFTASKQRNATMSFSSNLLAQSGEKKRTFVELLSSDDDDDVDEELDALLKPTGRTFTDMKKKTKTPEGAPSSSSFSEEDSKPPAKVKSSNSISKPINVESLSSPDLVGSFSTTPMLTKSAQPVPVTVESSANSPFLVGSSSSKEPPLKHEPSCAKKSIQVESSSLKVQSGQSMGSPSLMASPVVPWSDVKPAALSTLTPLGYVTFPIQEIKVSSATMLTMGQTLTMGEMVVPHDGSIFLHARETNAQVGSMDKRYAQHIVPLLRDRSATISLQCTIAQCIPGLKVLVRIQVFFKSLGQIPATEAALQTTKVELQGKLQKFGWTEGVSPPNFRTPEVRRGAGAFGNGKPIPNLFATTSLTAAERLLHNNQERVFYDETDDPDQLEETKDDQDPLKASTRKVVLEDVLALVVDTSEMETQADVEKLDQMFEELHEGQLKDLPQVKMPKDFPVFYKYQEDGVRWMLKQEQQDRIPPWYSQRADGRWVCQITKAIQQEKPSLVRGCVLADDMVRHDCFGRRRYHLTLLSVQGLGKTLQTLALIILNPPKGQNGYPYVRQSMSRGFNPRTTLIVAPVSVLSAWNMQIKEFVNKDGKKQILCVRNYHGANREDMIAMVSLNQVDILLTTYGTLTSDFKKYIAEKENDPSLTAVSTSKRGTKKRNVPTIFDLHFHRVVLDEAHIIRNANTGFFKACHRIHADHRLCLTGTPFVNHPQDIQSLLQFLQVQPFCNKKVFDKTVTKRIQRRDLGGLGTLRAPMACVTLRRTKANVLSTIKLVSKTVDERIVQFPPGEHKRIHDLLFATTRAAFVGLLKGKDHEGIADNYMQFMELVLRVRQSCCHVGLVPAERVEMVKNAHKTLQASCKKARDLNPELAELLLAQLRGLQKVEGKDEGETCVICFESFETLDITILKECRHVFCAGCLEQNQSDRCPLCRTPYIPDDLLTKKDVEDSLAVNAKKEPGKGFPSLSSRKLEAQYAMSLGRSPKIQALLDEVCV